MRILLFVCVLAVFTACSSSKKGDDQLQSGDWKLTFDVTNEGEKTLVNVRMHVDSTGRITIQNGKEIIQLSDIRHKSDTVQARISPYLSFMYWKEHRSDSIAGMWVDAARENYSVPFYATPFDYSNTSEVSWNKTFDVSFSPGTPDEYKSVGIFNREGNTVTGTFLTETGDFRFLEGRVNDNASQEQMTLGCFDGAHLFYFTASLENDSVKDGKFYSGKHFSDTWVAHLDPEATLRDPDSLTFLNPGYSSLKFQALQLTGDSAWFDEYSMQGKVTIVEIFGSWCPNCSDETRFFKSLYKKYGAENLNIIPVAFERGSDFEKHRTAVQNYAAQFELPFPVYIGGSSNKADCGRVFPALSAIMSYPTSIFIDKKGNVRKIHTGFYGPGTGRYYDMYTERIDMFVEKLINE